MPKDRITSMLGKHGVQQYLVDHQWVVAIDGTQKFARHQPFADQAVRRHFFKSGLAAFVSFFCKR